MRTFRKMLIIILVFAAFFACETDSPEPVPKSTGNDQDIHQSDEEFIQQWLDSKKKDVVKEKEIDEEDSFK